MNRRQVIAFGGAIGGGMMVGGRQALAQAAPAAAGFPNRPVRLVIPLVPGGSTDVIARIIAEPLSRMLGQPVIVENRPGANGWIANEYVARQPADGHTLIVNNVSTGAINEALATPDRRIRPSRDLAPITNLVELPQVLVAGAQVPATNLAEFIALAKAAPTPLAFASAGVGSYQHIDLEVFAKTAGITLLHVPLRGAGEMLAPVLRGDMQLTKLAITSVQQQIAAGRLRALAVDTTERLAQLPDVPTMTEQGFPGAPTRLWNGVFAPAGTPPAIIALLHARIAEVMADPALRASQEAQGVQVTVSANPDAFATYFAADVARWTRLIADYGINTTA
ncbi:Bug family tripartite tricarboxylate transporter substrate binding protein [Humitalea sp. 24SJ18S-53]|uniref:Bug family tripartite tricarboxylate transporter substrate binding protein n=1 Tax=Humitalea sp. 24SJ18S-53 TaxID=3422307 RepID=UPI003D665BDD